MLYSLYWTGYTDHTRYCLYCKVHDLRMPILLHHKNFYCIPVCSVELALLLPVLPYFRSDISVGMSDYKKIGS
jgi:hypothetical protein